MKKCHCVYQMPSVFCDENMTAVGLQLTQIFLSLIGGPGQASSLKILKLKYKFEADSSKSCTCGNELI